MTSEDSQRANSPTFENALEEITEIVNQIEGGGLALDKVVEKFRRATDLIRSSSAMLADMEQQLKTLEKDLLVPMKSDE